MTKCTLKGDVGWGKRGIMRADIGKELNLSVVGGAGDVVRLRLLDEMEERIETEGKTFYAELRSQETDERLASVGVTYSAERDVVLTLPEMAVGQYVLVVEVSADSGARERLLSGWVTYMEPGALVKPKVDFSPDRLVGVIMDGERHRCVWYHTTAAEIAAEKSEGAAKRAEAVVVELDAAVEDATKRAEDAAERAEEAATEAAGCAGDAEAAKDDAEAAQRATEEKLAGIDAVIEHWNRRVSSAIYPSSETGTWVVGDYVTGAFWQGVPAHIGTSGNWMNWNLETQSWDDSGVRAAGKDGFSPYVDALGCWVYVDPVTGQIRQGAPASGKDGRDGAAVRRIMVDSYEDIPQEGETCNGGVYYYVPLSDGGWNVYAWLETSSGVGSWVFIGPANDIATVEVHGLVRLGTGETVEGGAPVGNDADGGMAVPVAEPTVPGVIKPTNTVVFDSGGGTHMTSNNELRVDDATTLASGTVLLSYDGLVDTACIGLTADFRISVPWATLTQEGVIRLGSKLPHVNARPYIVGIGATVNHEIAFNVLTGGALKHLQGQSGWVAGMAPGVEVSGLNGESIFFGLDTSDSFSQSGGKLSLMEATGTLLGGVRKMLTLGSGSDVPTGDAVLDYLGLHYYRKESLYTRTELTRDGGVIDTELQSRVPLYATEELGKYVKSTYADERYAKATDVTKLSEKVTTIQSDVTSHGNSIAAVAKDVETLKNADGGYLKMVGAFAGTVELWGGSAEEFAKADITGKRMFMVLEN